MERVTGIEPAQSAWKAWDSKRHFGWSAASQEDAVPFACLSARRLVGPARGSAQVPLETGEAGGRCQGGDLIRVVGHVDVPEDGEQRGGQAGGREAVLLDLTGRG